MAPMADALAFPTIASPDRDDVI
jgi:predicted ATPase with chaperone activity